MLLTVAYKVFVSQRGCIKLLQAPSPLLVLTLSTIWLLVCHAAAQEPVFILGNDICSLKVLFFHFLSLSSRSLSKCYFHR